MITGRPKQPIVLQEEERVQLKAMAHSRSLPHGLVIRASLVLMAAEGVPNNRIAEKLDLSPQSVCKWRQRYLEQGPAGLHDELRPGRLARSRTRRSPRSCARRLRPNRKRYALEHPPDGPRDTLVTRYGSSDLAGVRHPTPSPKAF